MQEVGLVADAYPDARQRGPSDADVAIRNESDGRVIVAGAIDPATMANATDLLMNVEVWDPATGVFTLTELVPAPSPAPS